MTKLGNKIIDSIQFIHEILSNDILLQSNFISKILIQFYQSQSKDIFNILSEIKPIIQIIKQKTQECQENINDIQVQWQKIKKIANSEKGYLKAKQQQIKSKQVNMNAVQTGIKQTVSKIKPPQMAKLPVLKQKYLQNLFKLLYKLLYHHVQQQQPFNWKKFKKLALKHQSGQDFNYRLISFDFKQMKKQDYQSLLMLKNDPVFQNACVNTKYSYSIIDLADWIDYVCVGHKFKQQMKIAEKQYQKIRKDMNKKSGGSLQKSKQFWKQALQQSLQYQNNLQKLKSQFKALQIGAQNSIDFIQQQNQKKSQLIQKINFIIEPNN